MTSQGRGAATTSADAQYWLDQLRRGSEREQDEARIELGILLRSRGHVDDAIEAFGAAVAAGVSDPRPYDHLASIYEERGDPESASRVLIRKPRSGRAADSLTLPTREQTPASRRAWVFAAVALIGILALGLTGIASQQEQQRLARCSDVAIRFPESQDPEAAVLGALRQRGINVYATANPFIDQMVRPAMERRDTLIAGWIATSLIQSASGREQPNFSDYLWGWPEMQGIRSRVYLFANSGYIVPSISREAWDSLVNSPPSSCEGAFMADPRNSRWVRLMHASVKPDTSR